MAGLARSFVALICLMALCPLAASAAPPEPPRLVVLISVDQLLQEYLQRFHAGLAPDGFFARAAEAGYRFTDCHHGHAFTFTGPGHAVLLTGAYPRTSGIIANAWYDREQRKTINCVADEDAKIIGAVGGAGVSARNLQAPTLGDQLKLSFGPSAKVFGIGWKDRAPVLTAGRLADAAYWFDAPTGNWVTSDAYQEQLPGWLRVLNEGDAVRAYAGKSWTLLLEPEDYQNAVDDSPFETPGSGLTRTFPHTLPAADDSRYLRQLGVSPFANEYTLMTTRELIEHERLGVDDVPDLLCVCLSANDYVGHAFGPHSMEVEDMLYRTDRQLGELLDYLDEKVGSGHWVVALTSDHGVAPIPEYAASLGLDAARNPLGSSSDLRARIEAHLRESLDIAADEQPSLLLSVDSTQVFLRSDDARLAGDKRIQAQRIVRDWLLRQPSVAAAVAREDLLAGGGAGERLRVMIHRAFHKQRSGEVLYVMKPYQFEAGTMSTSHGSPWVYDTHVPLVFLGAGVTRGESAERVHPGSIAPTLADILQIAAPAACEHASLHQQVGAAE